jgi:hypothetical protein
METKHGNETALFIKGRLSGGDDSSHFISNKYSNRSCYSTVAAGIQLVPQQEFP